MKKETLGVIGFTGMAIMLAGASIREASIRKERKVLRDLIYYKSILVSAIEFAERMNINLGNTESAELIWKSKTYVGLLDDKYVIERAIGDILDCGVNHSYKKKEAIEMKKIFEMIDEFRKEGYCKITDQIRKEMEEAKNADEK